MAWTGQPVIQVDQLTKFCKSSLSSSLQQVASCSLHEQRQVLALLAKSNRLSTLDRSLVLSPQPNGLYVSPHMIGHYRVVRTHPPLANNSSVQRAKAPVAKQCRCAHNAAVIAVEAAQQQQS